jgi:hypothetical protein
MRMLPLELLNSKALVGAQKRILQESPQQDNAVGGRGSLFFFFLAPRRAVRSGLDADKIERNNDSPITAGRLYRKHPDVRQDRGRSGDSQHPSHGLPVHVRETGFARTAE